MNNISIRDFYDLIGGNYFDVEDRMQSGDIIKYFVIKFKNDTNFSKLTTAIKEKNSKEAFIAAHTLKGVCLNLGFNNLYISVNEITERLRTGNMDNIELYYGKVKEEYERTIAFIKLLN